MKSTDSFFRAYVQTALWSSTDSEENPLDREFSASDLAPETAAKMLADCAKFWNENAETINAAIATGDVTAGPDFNEYERAAHDFWLTRNRHGAGFWDGDWPEPMAGTLSAASRAFGECSLYVGDNGKIYC